MLLNLRKIHGARAHETVTRQYEPAAFEGADESYAVIAPVDLAFELDKDAERFRLAGRVRTTLELPCSRCLEPFALPVDAAFDLRYLPHSQNTGEGEVEIEDEDLATAYYDDETIDLGQLMREQFYLALPMKPLCSDACRGLCPVCGANLNRTTCACDRTWQDPRLAGLRAIAKKDDDA
ncbi:MAG: DUF177 domain-containing protein [Acidobacteriota bacterium]|nr:DUF177 domain-containing protein [Acidobacteriota bacterium]